MRALLCTVLLTIPLLAACGGAPKPMDGAEPKPYGLLQHPIIDEVASTLVDAASTSIGARTAPDARDRWMIPPIVGEDGVWEASALCFAIAAREGRLRPVQPTQTLASIPAVQAWLRANELANAIWVVEASGLIRPELKLVICTSERVWRSPVIPVSVPKAERFSWPFDPQENPPFAKVMVGDAEALVEVESEVYVQSRDGLRKLQWYNRANELRLDPLRDWKAFGRSWITRNLGAYPDRSPGLAVTQRDLRLEIRDADLPRGEGELVGWSLSRGGTGMELPLRRSMDIELWGLMATPYGWNLPDTWLVLRRPPEGEAYVEFFAASLRRLPGPARAPAVEAPAEVTVLSDLARPSGLPAFDARMEETHSLSDLALESSTVLYSPIYEWLAPLQLRQLDPSELPELRTARGRDGVGVVRFTAIDEEYPLWRSGSAKRKLAEGDRRRWREHRAAPLWGVAVLDSAIPTQERRALAEWLAARTPLELFGEQRPGLIPTLPITRRMRPASGKVQTLVLNRPVWLAPATVDGVQLGLPADWQSGQLERLALLLQDAGAEVAGVSDTPGAYPPEGALVIQLTRIHVEGANPTSRSLFLARALKLEAAWPGKIPSDPEKVEPGFAEEFETWLLEEGHLIPLWNEPGIVFIDRRLMGVRSDSTMVLPDLREARWLPESELQRLRPRS